MSGRCDWHAVGPSGTLTAVLPEAELLSRVLTGRLVRPAFQPVVDLERQATAGYEAFARTATGTGAEQRLGLGVLLLIDRHLAGPNSGVFTRLATDRSAALVLAVIAVVGAPLVEEMFFRGLLQRSL